MRNSSLSFPEKQFSMPAWLYQMSAGEIPEYGSWYPDEYRVEVFEGKQITWPVGDRIYYREQCQVSIGDTIIFFFCKTMKDGTPNDEPGIYGWGIIEDIAYYETEAGVIKEDKITFQVEPPSDYLKDHVCWDKDIEQITNDVRRRQWMGNMWNFRTEELDRLREKIRKHISKAVK